MISFDLDIQVSFAPVEHTVAGVLNLRNCFTRDAIEIEINRVWIFISIISIYFNIDC